MTSRAGHRFSLKEDPKDDGTAVSWIMLEARDDDLTVLKTVSLASISLTERLSRMHNVSQAS